MTFSTFGRKIIFATSNGQPWSHRETEKRAFPELPRVSYPVFASTLRAYRDAANAGGNHANESTASDVPRRQPCGRVSVLP